MEIEQMQPLLGKALKDLRERFGMTEEGLGAEIHASYKFVEHMESGRLEISDTQLEILREVFNGIDLYVYAWCKYGDVSKLPVGVQSAAQKLVEKWQKSINAKLPDSL